MNIETAIKTLEDHLKVVGDVAGSSYPIAMKLGIEALKRELVMIVDYDKDIVVKEIVSLATKRRVPIVSNKDIYESVTGLNRYSQKRWELLRPTLILLAKQLEHAVDGEIYWISSYSPMFAGHFNFYADEARNRPVAGFQVFKQTK